MLKLRLADGPGKSIDRVFTVWQREVPRAGQVVLGRL